MNRKHGRSSQNNPYSEETIENIAGEEMRIFELRNEQHCSVIFNNGGRTTTDLKSFRNGTTLNPMSEYKPNARVGRQYDLQNGLTATIIEDKGNYDIKVRISDGREIEGVSLKELKNGNIRALAKKEVKVLPQADNKTPGKTAESVTPTTPSSASDKQQLRIDVLPNGEIHVLGKTKSLIAPSKDTKYCKVHISITDGSAEVIFDAGEEEIGCIIPLEVKSA